jgi:hypothetical protein
MPKVVEYGRWALENMGMVLEALRNGEVGLNAASRANSLRNNT